MSTTDHFENDEETDGAGTPKETTHRASRSTELSRRLFSNSGVYRDPLRSVSNTHSSEFDTQRLILEELRKTNSRVDTFSEHMESMDGRFKSVEQRQLNSTTPSSSTSDGSASKSKRKVPAKVAVSAETIVRHLTLCIYACMLYSAGCIQSSFR